MTPSASTAGAFDTLPCAWLRIDGRSRIVAANPALCRLVGKRLPELLNQPFDTLLTKSAQVLFQSYLQPLLHLHGHVEELALTLRATAGSDEPTVLIYTSRRTEAARDDGVDMVLAPIRRRQRIEEEMLRIKRAADQSPGVIFQLLQAADGQQHFPYASESIRQLYGCSAEAARESAEAVFRSIAPPDRRRAAAGMHVAARDGRVWRGRYRVRQPDGSVHWHEAQATPRRLAFGVTLWHGYAADVTERHEMETAMRDREAIQRLHLARGEFLARMSHELRTPLNGILGFAQLLGSDRAANLSDTQHERVNVIETSARHLLQLINEVLDLTRLESAPVEVPLASFELRAPLEAAARALQSQAIAARVRLLPPTCEPTLRVHANEQRLHQVLTNLLSNAVKYNRPGGEVRIEASATPEGVCVAVCDTGPGLSLEQRQQLFQPFNRLGAENGPVEGSGLGLVISEQLMQRMGGRIEVDSAPGHGTTFRLYLPEGNAAPPAGAKPATAAANGEAAVPLAPARGTVLYTEDNPVNAILMEAIIGLRPQLRLTTVRDGAMTLEAALRSPPDLMLLDMHLPDTDGSRLLAALRQHAALRHVPAIAVSAAANASDIANARAQGFADYWTKPLDIGQTLAALDRLLGPGNAPG